MFWRSLDGVEMRLWPRQQESNLYFTLRRHTFYPLNYGECLRVGMLYNVFYGSIKAVAAVLNKRPVNLLRQYLLRERLTGRLGLI